MKGNRLRPGLELKSPILFPKTLRSFKPKVTQSRKLKIIYLFNAKTILV